MSKIVWITGLSGSGKTTLGKSIVSILRKKGEKVVYLDGDELRDVFDKSNLTKKNHDRKSRLSLSYKYSKLCKLLQKQGFTVVISTISMFKEIYEWNYKNFQNYREIYLKVPIEVLKQRDVKNIYKGYFNGTVRNVAGLDLEVDEPKNAFVINFDKNKTEDTIKKIILNYISGEKIEN